MSEAMVMLSLAGVLILTAVIHGWVEGRSKKRTQDLKTQRALEDLGWY